MNCRKGDLVPLVEDLEKANVIKRGHFLLTSGRHSDTYINKDSIFCNPVLFNDIINVMFLKAQKWDFDVITGPAIAGAVLAAPLSYYLGKIFVYPEKVLTEPYYQDKKNYEMKFRRGYDKVLKDKKVLIVEDIITTGGSVLKTIDSIYDCGGVPGMVLAIWNRSGWSNNHCEVDSLINEKVESWDQDEHGNCPDCHNGIPLVDPKTMKEIK